MRNWFLRQPLPFFMSDNPGGAPANDPPANNGNVNGNRGSENDPPEDEFEDFWRLDDDDDPDADGGDHKNKAPGRQDQNDPAEAIDRYIDGRIPKVELNFSQEEQQAIQDGDMSPVVNAVRGQMTGMYKAMLGDVGQLINKMKKTIVDEAVNTSSNTINARQAVSQLNEKLPWTAEPAIAPIANAALKQFIKKGKSVAEAIDAMPRYFQRMGDKAAGRGNQNKGRGYNRGNTNNGNSAESDGDDEDFLDILGTRKQ